MQVCTGRLYASRRGFALALGISEESVIDYRKRTYQRFRNRRRELLL
jgi:hypothetical protein